VAVLVSQLLLVALALAWAIHMIIVAANGMVYFVEGNVAVLWLEISSTLLISVREHRKSNTGSRDPRN
jgi:hypothetical protein